MTYELAFLAPALNEWRKLDAHTREQFRRKLAEGLEEPRVPSARLSDARDRYKIKLRNVGYRLVYEVRDAEVVLLVVAVGATRPQRGLSRRGLAERQPDRERHDDVTLDEAKQVII